VLIGLPQDILQMPLQFRASTFGTRFIKRFQPFTSEYRIPPAAATKITGLNTTDSAILERE